MRILSFFFKFGLFLVVLGALGYLFGGTLWLKMGTFGFINEVNALTNTNKQLQQYTPMCQQASSASQDSTPLGVQLRFTNNTHYVIELVCSLIEDSPIKIREGNLLPLITKDPGSAGFYYAVSGQNDAWVSLGSLGKHAYITLKDDTVSLHDTAETVLNSLPKSECDSFGYSCCNDGSLLGEGEARIDGVTDCPGKCFPVCQKVPYVELFASDPAATIDTRELTLTQATNDIVFNYGVNSANGKITEVQIDYGDGATDSSTLPQGVFTHTYNCSGPCKYTVSLQARDITGKVSIATQESKIYIVKK